MSTREMFIDKSSWTVTKFGDVAIQQKVNVNREDTTLTKYVKGEHMSSEDIHLRSWGELQDEYLGPAFIRYFEEGDILYGSRRTYLKKVSIAPFEGITSNTTFVIKANEEKIDKRLLPFLMLSDGFTEHSIMHSKGSVNPYINWKDLANYEFLLPPIDQQAELAELLWAIDALVTDKRSTLDKLKIARRAKLKLLKQQNPTWTNKRLGDIVQFSYGKALKESDRVAGDFLVVTSSGVQGSHNKYLTEAPGIVVGRKGNVGQVTWVEKNFWTTDTAYYITLKEKYLHLNLRFVFYLLEALDLEKLSISTAVPGLNRDDAMLQKVGIPDKEYRELFIEEIQQIENVTLKMKNNLRADKNLQKALINQIF